MILKTDKYVKNPLKEEWGTGKVLENVGNDIYEVFFLEAGLKKFNRKQNPLIEVENNQEQLFENLSTNKSEKFTTTSELIEYFLKNYEGGFEGQEYKDRERYYKDKAKNLINELLSKVEYEKLLENSSYEEIIKRILKCVNSTNLIFPNEKMALKDGLVSFDKQKDLSHSLYDFLYLENNKQLNFEKLAYVLENIGADKWTIISYFPFFINSNTNIFIKPTITQNIADITAFNIEYNSKLNWITYKKIQEFANLFKNNISTLNPKDMIDVQSFIWCVSGK